MSAINQSVSLASYEGQRLLLQFEAHDSAGQEVLSQQFFVPSSRVRTRRVANAAGTILDDSPDRTLSNDLHPTVLEKAAGRSLSWHVSGDAIM